jgi:hypothetical protein
VDGRLRWSITEMPKRGPTLSVRNQGPAFLPALFRARAGQSNLETGSVEIPGRAGHRRPRRHGHKM